MSDEAELSMSIPLDEDGFLRRECPTCEREFKLFVPDEDELKEEEEEEEFKEELKEEEEESEDEFEDEFEEEFEGESASANTYFCPYCGVEAPRDSWHTKAQIALAETMYMREVLGPELLARLGRPVLEHLLGLDASDRCRASLALPVEVDASEPSLAADENQAP